MEGEVSILCKEGDSPKTVIQAIPMYTMSVFQLPKALCQEKEMKVARMTWSRLSNIKLKGGLGFHDLESFNKALLAKQCWRLLQNHNSLMARTFK